MRLVGACKDKPARHPAREQLEDAVTERDWKAEYEKQRASAREWCNRYVDLVVVGRRLADYQPSGHAQTQKEADLWAKFYKLLNDAPVTFSPGLSRLPPDTAT
jgi:hypothetical protein